MEYGSEFDARANDAFVRAFPGFVGDDWLLFRSGRDAMKAFARALGPRHVLLPALCCDSMIVPLALCGCELGFYRMRADLRADEWDVLQKARPGTLLIYTPYFGVHPFSDAFLQRLREAGVFLAEDRTQDIVIRRAPGGFEPDAVFASLRKWAALPEGGMLRTGLPAETDPADSRFGDMRQEAMEKKTRYLQNGDPALKRDFLRELHEAEELLDQSPAAPGMCGKYREQLLQLDLGEIGRVRLRNLRRLAGRLEPLRQADRLRFLSDTPEDSGLYLPILLDDREPVKKALWARSAYHPVIWPEPPRAAGLCPNSRYVVEHMLALIVDQRCSLADMDQIADDLIEIIDRQESRKP